MIFKSKSLFFCLFELIKGNVARNTNPQVHRLHLATAPMGTLVTGLEYNNNSLTNPNIIFFYYCFDKLMMYLIVVFLFSFNIDN